MEVEASNAIQYELLNVSDENNCRILGARDIGSRSRGEEHAESDYDVMFIFCEPPATYALGRDSDAIERTVPASDSYLDREIELSGWSLKRFVGGDGITGSNPTAIEYADSDTVYWPERGFLQEICDEAVENFKPYALMNHYRSMAASNYGKYIEQSWVREWSFEQFEEYSDKHGGQTSVDEERGVLTIGVLGYDEHTVEIPLDEASAEGMIRRTTSDPTVKRHVNVLRALCRARYIEEHHEIPPTNTYELIDEIMDSEWLRDDVMLSFINLLGDKRNGDNRDIDYPHVNRWVENELDRDIEPEEHVHREPDYPTVMTLARNIYNDEDWYL